MMIPDIELTEKEEMLLERLWCLKETGRNNRGTLKGPDEKLFQSFLDRAFVRCEGEAFEFTEKGHHRAQGVVRRRRLTEVLLYNVLDLSLNVAETSACKIEHIINEEVTESICAFLGHPIQCPHGKPIPSGACCHGQKDRVKPLIEPLKSLSVGKKARVVFITSEDSGVLQRLTSLGLCPGVVIVLRQHTPTAILRVGETDIALDPSFVDHIYCRPVRETGVKKGI